MRVNFLCTDAKGNIYIYKFIFKIHFFFIAKVMTITFLTIINSIDLAPCQGEEKNPNISLLHKVSSLSFSSSSFFSIFCFFLHFFFQFYLFVFPFAASIFLGMEVLVFVFALFYSAFLLCALDIFRFIVAVLAR